ncbi:MAG: hypothetical protein J6B77_04550, partial [Clostridia bacterium]|nr:hypothetical protein [Clostridia bacterium]
ETVLPRFSDFSILSLTSPQGIYCSSAEKQWFSLDCGYLICLCLLYLAVAVILTSVAWGQYNGRSIPKRKGGNRV